MDPLSPTAPPLCPVRTCLEDLARALPAGNTLTVDPRISHTLPCEEKALRDAMQEFLSRLGPEPGPHTVVAYELDDPTRCLLRIEVPGTDLGFTFPPQEASPAPEAPEKSSLSILLAEDNHTNQHVAVECLRSLGFECRIVETGAAAVQAVREQVFDLIFMDIHMPEMDGLEATRIIRTLPNGHHPVIAALTAYAMPGDKARALDAGMDDYITKPCRLETLGATIKKTLARKF